MKISDILKSKGIFSKDIKQRFQQNQIKINGVVVDDIDIFVHQIFDGPDWFFTHFFSKLSLKKRKMFDILVIINGNFEEFFDGGFTLNGIEFDQLIPELEIFKSNIFLRVSKKEFFIIELKIIVEINSEDTTTWD